VAPGRRDDPLGGGILGIGFAIGGRLGAHILRKLKGYYQFPLQRARSL
jgi:hypothetical protein